ncbi:tetratricopeptide repeat protein [Microvirga arabica]|uniref:tetratricopeptide repeat protein n=1 Tax=Microvirga arabica TaxID=1128671 RepID=UPI00193A2D66|nr:tetratricopeptide repeat protein [Microvirga arabica]MBM1170860.1 tetratricopeptide repeat protein [Microvirga arabica]
MHQRRLALRTRFASLAFLCGFGLAASPALAQTAKDIVEQARQAASTNENQQAARLFEQAITAAPERRNELLLEYADQVAYAGRPADAVPLYRERLNDPALDTANRERAERGLAFALLWSSRFQEAIAAWEARLRADPASDEARNTLSDALVGAARQAGERSENANARTLFGRAIETAPQRRQELLPEFADQTAYAGQPDQAVPLYHEALRDGSRPEDQQRRLRRGLAFALLWSGQFPAAVAALDDVLRAAPDDAQVRQGLAEARAGVERGRAQAAQPSQAAPAPAQQAPAVAPASPADAAIASAREAAGRGANKEAASLFERAIGLDPSKRAQIGREYADQLAFSGEPGRAVPVYREVLARRDLPPGERQQATRALAFALLWSSQFQQAIEAWGNILQADRSDAEARKALSDSYVGAARQAAERTRNADAAAFFRRAIETASQRRQELLPEYADQTAYSGNPAGAVPLYREALRDGQRPEAERRRVRRGLAFALLWSNQFREAIAAWQPLFRENPRDEETRKAFSDALVGAARQAAGQTRNAEAVNLFERALTVMPGRRRELLREYAEQVLYAGQPLRAIPLFQEVLQRGDLNGQERRDARLGLARALAWSGQQKLALPVFSEILASNANDIDALIGRGNALNDITDHRAALADFEVVLSLQPSNVEAIRGAATAERSMGLPQAALARLEPLLASGDRNPATLFIAAQARREMGRPDLSEDYAKAVLAQKPGDAGALALLDQLYQERRPLTRIESWYARRSDDLAIWSLQASHELTFNDGLTKFGPQARFMRYRGDDFPSVDMSSIGIAGQHRFGDHVEFKSSIFLNFEDEARRNRPDGENDQDVTLTHDTTLSLIPSDLLRFDLNLVRRYADENTRSIVNDVLANDFGLKVLITPDNATRFNAQAIYSHYSDGNERAWGQVEFAKRFTANPYFWLGARYTAFEFEEVVDNGYWNPERYQSLEASVHFYGPLAERWWFDLQGAAGYGWSEPGEGGFVSYASARLNYDFTSQATFALYASHLVSYARSSEDDGNFDAGQDDEPFSRWSVGGELRIRW